MKIFKFKSSEKEWIYAENLKKAIEYYTEVLGLNLSERRMG